MVATLGKRRINIAAVALVRRHGVVGGFDSPRERDDMPLKASEVAWIFKLHCEE